MGHRGVQSVVNLKQVSTRVPYGRRQEIYDYLRSSQRPSSVAELAERFAVSEVTIRRDVKWLLSEAKLVKTVYGGVMASQEAILEVSLATRLNVNLEEKQKIGIAAVRLLRSGDTVALDNSTTTLELVKLLQDFRDLTVVTNSVKALAVLAQQSGITVHLTGGILLREAFSLVGPSAERSMREFNVDKAIISAKGLDPAVGLTQVNLFDIEVKKAMIASAKEVIVLADHTKLGKMALATVCPLSAIHKVVTDDQADPRLIARLEEKGIEVIIGR
jgi:DeoR family fructose operon transcriptional repressor